MQEVTYEQAQCRIKIFNILSTSIWLFFQVGSLVLIIFVDNDYKEQGHYKHELIIQASAVILVVLIYAF
jgi:hypothetical protein